MKRRKSSLNKKGILRPPEEVKSNFYFDIIVTKYDSYHRNTSNIKKISISVQLNKKIIDITGNRINTTDFVHGTGTDFQVNAEKFKQNLGDCGMPFSVIYNGLILGTGQLLFPESYIESITDDMPELIHSDLCYFERKGEVLGTVEFLCRLVLKCQYDASKGISECRQNLGTSINPKDILFIMDESQKIPQPYDPCDPCLDALESGDERINLDLLRYRSYNSLPPSPAATLIHNPVCDQITCELKKMAKECEETMDFILSGTRGPESSCRTADVLRGPCHIPLSYQDSKAKVSVSKAPSLPANLGRGKTTPVSSNTRPGMRFCPVCQTNMSWLPLFTTCPKCGVKPVPVPEKIDKKNDLKAEQIIIEYLGKPSHHTTEDICRMSCNTEEENTKAKEKESKTQCRCTCKYGKTCASCRVREQCAEYLDNSQIERLPPSTEKESEPEIDCGIADVKPKESRPFLSRLFSELRIMYDIKDTVNQEDFAAKVNELHPKRKKQGNLPLVVAKKNEAKKRVPLMKMPRKFPRIITSFHRICTKKRQAVSRQHGWAWDTTQEARKHGWKPGAVLRPMKKLMQHFLEKTPAICKKEREKIERELPTLNMCKRNGEIFVTLRAIKSDTMQIKPIIFRIVKSDKAELVSSIKKKLKQKGYSKCKCHQTVMMCTCRDTVEKRQLEQALNKECKLRGYESVVDQLVLTDTSESDMDFDFDFDVTPTEGAAKPVTIVRPRMNHSTQTQLRKGPDELMVNPKYPNPTSPYYHSYDCAVGDRYINTAHGKPGEIILEDGLFGYRGGGPHGPPSYPQGRPKAAVIWGTKPGGPMHSGGRFGQQTIPGGETFPGAKTQPSERKKKKTIPVRMTNRFYMAAEKAATEALAAKEDANKKKPTDMMAYMMKKGAVPIPYNPRANAYY